MLQLSPTPSRATDARLHGRWLLAIIAAGVVLRLILAASVGLGVDESYTIANARHVQLSYFDHPPLSFWLVRAATLVFGSEVAVVVRLPFILLFAATTAAMYLLTARLYGVAAGFWAAVLLNLAPVFGLTSGGWILPDGPLLLFLLLTVLILERLLFAGDLPRRRAWALGLLGGVTLGLACLAKYHGFLAGASVLLFLLTSPRHRRWLADPIPYAALAVMLLVCLPVLWWNIDNDWVSVRFQMGRAGARGLHPDHVVVNILGQMLYLTPWLWLPLLWVYGKAIRRGPGDAGWLLVCLASVPLLLFTLVPLWGSRGLPHWQAPGYLMLFPLLGAATARALAEGSRRARRWLAFSIAAPLVVIPLLAAHVATGWLETVVPAAFHDGDPTVEMLDWTELRAAVAAEDLPPGGFVVSVRWLQAGKIDAALGGDRPVLVFTHDPRNFAFQHDQRAFLGQDALIIGPPEAVAEAVAGYAAYFAAFDPPRPVALHRGGRVAIELAMVRAHSFRRPYPLRFGPGAAPP